MRNQLKTSLAIVLALLAFVIAPSHARAARQGDIIINEIMIDPSAVLDTSGEWFELYNTTDRAIDIEGWTISDADVQSHSIVLAGTLGPLTIAAHGYLVLGNNDGMGTNGGVAIDYEYSFFTLQNVFDEIILIDEDMNEIDRVDYGPALDFPAPTGASIAFQDTLLTSFSVYQNNRGKMWAASTSDFGGGDLGTPGSINDGQVERAPSRVMHDWLADQPVLSPATSQIGDDDRAVAFLMKNSITVESFGIAADFGAPTVLTVTIRALDVTGFLPVLGDILATASMAVAPDELKFYDIPIDFTFEEGRHYDVAFNVTTGWGFGEHTVEFFDDFFNTLLDPDAVPVFDAGAFKILSGRGTNMAPDLYANTFLPHVRANAKLAFDDLDDPFDSPALIGSIGDEDRALAIAMKRTTRIATVGILLNMVDDTFTRLTATIRPVIGGVIGLTVASSSTVIFADGIRFYDVPLQFTLQEGQIYDIAFNVTDGWNSGEVQTMEFYSFDNPTLDPTLAFDSGAYRVLDGRGSTDAAYTNALLPHVRIGEPAPGLDLAPPGLSGALDSALGVEDRGIAIEAGKTMSVRSFGVFAAVGEPSDLIVNIRAVDGLSPGRLLASSSLYVLPGDTSFFDIPLAFTFSKGERYDISFNVSGGWGSPGPHSLQLFDFNNPTLDLGMGFAAGSFTVLDGRGGPIDYANAKMPRVRVCLAEAFEDLRRPTLDFIEFSTDIGDDDRGIGVEMTERVVVTSLGVYAKIEEPTTLTVTVRDLNGAIVGGVLATESVAIEEIGPAFFDVPIDFTFEPPTQDDPDKRYDIAFNITGGWTPVGGVDPHGMEFAELINPTLDPGMGYEVGPFRVLSGRGADVGFTNTLVPRFRACYPNLTNLEQVVAVDFLDVGDDSNDWTSFTSGGATADDLTGLCMTVPGPGENSAVWVSPERYIDLIDMTVYRVRVEVSTSQTLPDAIPFWGILYDNFNMSGKGNTFGGESWFLDIDGGAQGIGRAQGRPVYEIYIAPNAIETQQWRGIIDTANSAFSVAADAFNDIRLTFRVLDFAAAPIGSGADSGEICIERLEVDAVPLEGLLYDTVLYNAPIATSTHFAETLTQSMSGNTPTIDDARGTANYALASPDDRSTLGPFDSVEPDLNKALYPVVWEENTLYRGRIKIRSNRNAGVGPEGVNPVDVIALTFDTSNSELGQIHYTTRGAPTNMNRAASPRLAQTTGDQAQSYTGLFFSQNATRSPTPSANRLRFQGDFFTALSLFGAGGTDAFTVEELAVDRMIAPDFPN